VASCCCDHCAAHRKCSWLEDCAEEWKRLPAETAEAARLRAAAPQREPAAAATLRRADSCTDAAGRCTDVVGFASSNCGVYSGFSVSLSAASMQAIRCSRDSTLFGVLLAMWHAKTWDVGSEIQVRERLSLKMLVVVRAAALRPSSPTPLSESARGCSSSRTARRSQPLCPTMVASTSSRRT